MLRLTPAVLLFLLAAPTVAADFTGFSDARRPKLGAMRQLTSAEKGLIASADFTGFNDDHPPKLMGVRSVGESAVSGNPQDHESMVFHRDGAYFEAQFAVSEAVRRFWRATLSVRHLSSHAKDCRNEGWSPVTIAINDRLVVKGHSPAEHGYMTEEWEVGSLLRRGPNTIRFSLDGSCSKYWLQGFSVRDGPPQVRAARDEKRRRVLAALKEVGEQIAAKRAVRAREAEEPLVGDDSVVAVPGGRPMDRVEPGPPPPGESAPLRSPVIEDEAQTVPRGGPRPLAVLAVVASLLAGVYWLGMRRGRTVQPRKPPVAGSGPAPEAGARAAAVGERPSPGGTPQTVGKYRVLSTIGRGGMGEVFAADDPVLGRKVALKRMRAELASEPGTRERFLQEARIISHLTHPYIVSLYDVLEEGGDVYLVFEFIDGKPLSTVMAERRRIPMAETIRLMNYVCQAVDIAHRNRILHRDLKPSNIMVDVNGFAKVMDFGIAREAKESVSRMTHTDSSGTLAYMAPEQHMGQSHRASDVYALGVCVYEMLTGQLPFGGPDFLAQKERKKYPPPQYFAPDLPRDIEDLMASVLDPDHNKRMAEPMALVDGLRALTHL